jgi:hypothetical protein
MLRYLACTNALARAGVLKPVVATELPLYMATRAHELLEWAREDSYAAWGGIVLRVRGAEGE